MKKMFIFLTMGLFFVSNIFSETSTKGNEQQKVTKNEMTESKDTIKKDKNVKKKQNKKIYSTQENYKRGTCCPH